ncbi:hypothetical protein [Sinorhizobium medicae]|uniref:hypothetical protein n=1 Tax=Sinorhizobium medicae TaxID=110321 RepID=UPI00308682DD|nr:hypothetical protein U8C38_26290 [Sinorhizobium medicae]
MRRRRQSTSFQCLSDWAHNARYQDDEAKKIVRYAFHPRAGAEIFITGRQRYCGEPAYVGRQPDGSLALIPIWMTEEIALTMAVREAPRFPLSSLRDLRREVDAGLRFLQSDSRQPGDDHAAQAMPNRPARPVFHDGSNAEPSGRSAGTNPPADRSLVEGSGGEPDGTGGRS